MQRFATHSEHRHRRLVLLLMFGVFGLLSDAAGIEPDSTRHLFDFSSDRAQVFVDPLLDLSWGPAAPGPAAVWRNVRGASFSAAWDSSWTAWGTLEEHQSLRVGADAHWTAMNGALPGWGRAKLGTQDAYRTADSLYIDVARAEGAVKWQAPRGGWTVELGVWRWDWGLSEATVGALGHRSAVAPSPRLRLARSTETSTTWFESTKWVLDQRGPLGETAESLFEWTRTAMLGHEHKGPRGLSAGVVFGFTSLAEQARLKSTGWTHPYETPWAGAHFRWSHHGWWLGGEVAAGWSRGFDSEGWTTEGIRFVAAAGKKWASGQITAEHLQQPGDFTTRAHQPTEHSLLTHAGLPVGSIWSQHTAIRMLQVVQRLRSNCQVVAGKNNFSDFVSAKWSIQPFEEWRIHLNANIIYWAEPNLTTAQIGLTWSTGERNL